MTVSRRDFLQQAGAAAVLSRLHRTPTHDIATQTLDELVPEFDEAVACSLVRVAVEAARTAGAQFADVRFTSVRSFSFTVQVDRFLRPGITFPTDYGVRVLVDGAWGFAGGYSLAPDDVAEVARAAVARARSNRPHGTRHLSLAPTPRVERGRWAAPIAQDPFAVPIAQYAELMQAAGAAAKQVPGYTYGILQCTWERRLHVFASSDDSLIVQRFAWASPSSWVTGRSRSDYDECGRVADGLRMGAYGFESVQDEKLDLVAAMRNAAERAVAESAPPAPPPVSAEVGRYDLVLGTQAVSALLGITLAPALNLERVLGYAANGDGTSFAAPPSDIIGKYRIASPLVTIRADRTRPHATGTVGWDDEGVPAGEYTVVNQGIVADYFTSRQTAAELSPLYAKRGVATSSRGCVGGRGQDRPVVQHPNLTLLPGRQAVSADDLIGETKRGYYVVTAWGGADQQLLSGQFKGIDVREIRNGKLGRQIKDLAFQFAMPQLWTKIDAIGGPGSAVDGPGRDANISVVPVRVREVNVLNTGITL